MENREEIEQRLTEWAANNARRDDLVCAALVAGITPNRIHTLTGIARTTIYRIKESTMTQRCDYEFEIATNEFFEDDPKWDYNRQCYKAERQRWLRDDALKLARNLLDEYPQAYAVRVYEFAISGYENEFGRVEEERTPSGLVATVTR